VRVDGREVTLERALRAAADVLAEARWPLVYLAPDLSCQAQRLAVALADRLHAAIDSVTSATAMSSVLASQELGHTSATFGEIRHRADLLVFWGVDPAATHPRFRSRYLQEADALHLPEAGRTIVAVDIGAWTGPSDADVRCVLDADEEVTALTLLAAQAGGSLAKAEDKNRRGRVWSTVDRLGRLFADARYVAIVIGVDDVPDRDPGRARATTALSQALNGLTRCAVAGLRAGGNCSGADAVMTSQTGFPAAVDFARGVPRYRPFDGTAQARLARGEVDVAVVLGSAGRIPAGLVDALGRGTVIAIGSHASASPLSRAQVLVDAGVAGIHHAGTALRMDDVPLPLRPVVQGPPSVEDVIQPLSDRMTGRLRAWGA